MYLCSSKLGKGKKSLLQSARKEEIIKMKANTKKISVQKVNRIDK